jgi:hypothetical protein
MRTLRIGSFFAMLLAASSASADDNLDLREREAIARFLDRPVPAATQIDLPSLDDGSADIVPDNVSAMAALYFAAMLDDMKLFAAADKVADQVAAGELGLGGKCEPCRKHKDARGTRFTEPERRAIYAHAFGFASGSPAVTSPNNDFAGLWIRFLSAVSSANADVRKAGRELAVNLSVFGIGAARQAAPEMRALVESARALLSEPSVLSAYGAKTMWQVVEAVSTRYLGGAPNRAKLRAQAVHGATIIQWLAVHAGDDAAPMASSAREWLTAAAVTPAEIARADRLRTLGPKNAWPLAFAPICVSAAHRIVPCTVRRPRAR